MRIEELWRHPLRFGTPGWTGGQYSLFRALFGCYLAVHFGALLPWSAELFSNRGVLQPASASPLLHLFPNALALSDDPTFVALFIAVAACASLLVAVGWHDRPAAVFCWYALACLFGRNPLIANPSLPFVGWLLLAHACLQPAPYGSWAGRSQVDPTRWRMDRRVHAAAWIVMALGYSYSGYTKLASPSWLDGSALAFVLRNPLARSGGLPALISALPPDVLRMATWGALALELGFAPLACLRLLRPFLWLAMVGVHLGLLAIVDFADLSLAMLLFHFFTFDPKWVPPRVPTAPRVLFYDGDCGLCNRFVRFLLAEDRHGNFVFAPLQGSSFAAVPAAQRIAVPDSVVLQSRGMLLTRSAAVLAVLKGLGGVWRVLGLVLRLVPSLALDWAYDRVAAVRKQIFAPPSADACSLMPPELRKRFLS